MKKAWEIGVLACCIALCICVYPLCLMRRDINIDAAPQGPYIETESEAQELRQFFVAQSSYLSELDFDIVFPDGKPDTGELTITIMDGDGKVVVEKAVPLSNVNDGAYTPVSVGKWIKKGSLYSYVVSGGVIFRAVYAPDGESDAAGSGALYFDGELIEGKAVARYVYGFPLNVKNIICLWAFLWMLCFILTGWFGDRDFLCHSKWRLRAEKLLEKWQIPILVMELAIVLAMIIRISRNEAVEWDEAFTWQIVTKNNVAGMLKATAADVHPPLYYLLVMGAMAIFGKNLFVAKMVSVAGVAAVGVLGITLVRKRWGVRTAIPFILVSGLGTEMVYFSVNVRMYSWVIFFVMAAGLFAYEIIQSGKPGWWIGFTVVSLCGVYTQYYAVVPLALIYVGLLLWIILNDKAQFRKWILCSFATVIGYLPWLTVVFDTLKRDANSTKVGEAEQKIDELCRWAFGCNIELSEYMPALLFVVAVLCLLLEWKRFGKKERAFLVSSGGIFFAAYGLCMVIASYTQHLHRFRMSRLR